MALSGTTSATCGSMVYNYLWPQDSLASPMRMDGLKTASRMRMIAVFGGCLRRASRMRMIALTPRRNYKKVASNLVAHGYSPVHKERFEEQALEREMPQFPGFFSRKEKALEGVSSRQASPHLGKGRTPRTNLSADSTDQFQRPRLSHMPLLHTQGSEERLTSSARAPLSPKVRGCAVAPALSCLRLDDANLRCEAPSPGLAWSNEEVKNIFPGPCKVMGGGKMGGIAQNGRDSSASLHAKRPEDQLTG